MKKILVSGKKYEIACENFKHMSKARSDLEIKFIESQTKCNDYYEEIQNLANKLDYMEEEQKTYKNEIKRLKIMLSKNKINYKRKDKKDKNV